MYRVADILIMPDAEGMTTEYVTCSAEFPDETDARIQASRINQAFWDWYDSQSEKPLCTYMVVIEPIL